MCSVLGRESVCVCVRAFSTTALGVEREGRNLAQGSRSFGAL